MTTTHSSPTRNEAHLVMMAQMHGAVEAAYSDLEKHYPSVRKSLLDGCIELPKDAPLWMHPVVAGSTTSDRFDAALFRNQLISHIADSLETQYPEVADELSKHSRESILSALDRVVDSAENLRVLLGIFMNRNKQ